MSLRSIGRLFLVLYGVGLFAFGILFLFSPGSLTAMVDIELPTPVASMDVRAVYGGLFVGVGLFWMVCARGDSLLRPGLISLALTMGGLSVGRTVGLTDGSPNALIVVLYAMEILATVVAFAALRASGVSSHPIRRPMPGHTGT